MKNNAVLLLGTNMGSRETALLTASNLIVQNLGSIQLKSGVYETEPWGNISQAAFLNQALVITTSIPAKELLKGLLQIEETMGRKRKNKWEPRLIDIDILFFNDDVIHTDSLKVPHPLLQDRRFALTPLNELMPAYRHPVLKRTVRELLSDCKDQQQVKLYI